MLLFQPKKLSVGSNSGHSIVVENLKLMPNLKSLILHKTKGVNQQFFNELCEKVKKINHDINF